MSEQETNILVVGGGISGLTTAVEAAEARGRPECWVPTGCLLVTEEEPA